MLLSRGGGSSHNLFDKIISLPNLFHAWREFKRGKMNKSDVQNFALNLEDNLFDLHTDLQSGNYRHSPYTDFFVRDPKLRHIFKATVRDRVLHQAVVSALEPIFDNGFIANSYSSRLGKGTHRAISCLRKKAWRLSKNNTRTVWILHGDIRRYFDSVDHEILLRLIERKVGDTNVLNLLTEIIGSYSTAPGKGIPLGNVTSQLFSNIYLDEFDQFITRHLGIQDYIRYADDFVVISRSQIFLESMITLTRNFLSEKLKLVLHPDKIVLRRWHSGVDFLGYVLFPHHNILRTKTKWRMFNRINSKNFISYSGMLRHCRSARLRADLLRTVDL